MVVNNQQQQLLYVFAKEVAAAVRVGLTSGTSFWYQLVNVSWA